MLHELAAVSQAKQAVSQLPAVLIILPVTGTPVHSDASLAYGSVSGPTHISIATLEMHVVIPLNTVSWVSSCSGGGRSAFGVQFTAAASR